MEHLTPAAAATEDELPDIELKEQDGFTGTIKPSSEAPSSSSSSKSNFAVEEPNQSTIEELFLFAQKKEQRMFRAGVASNVHEPRTSTIAAAPRERVQSPSGCALTRGGLARRTVFVSPLLRAPQKPSPRNSVSHIMYLSNRV